MSNVRGAVRERAVAGRIHRNIVLLGVVSLLADVSSEMVYPIIPLFLSGTLGAPVVAVGLIEGIAESTASIGKLLSGWYSDRIRRRVPFAFSGYALSAVAKPLIAAAAAWPIVLGARFIDRSGKGLRSAPRDALIASSAEAGTLGRSFGLHRAMDTLGAVAGPLIAIGLLAWLGENEFRPVFLLAFIPGAAAALLTFGVREIRPPERPAGERAPSLVRGWDPRFVTFLAIALLFTLGNSSDAFLILRAHDLGLGTMTTVAAYVVFNIVYAACSLPAGIASDRVGKRAVLVVGFTIFAATYAGFALAADAMLVWPLFAAYGVYIALTEGISRAYVADLVPDARRGTALGLHAASTGIMLLLASVLGGALWDLFGPRATFALGASTGLAAAALLAATELRRPRRAG